MQKEGKRDDSDSFFLRRYRKNRKDRVNYESISDTGRWPCVQRNSIGSDKEIISEMRVFNTSMTGYLEVLTDPSYAGQSVCV